MKDAPSGRRMFFPPPPPPPPPPPRPLPRSPGRPGNGPGRRRRRRRNLDRFLRERRELRKRRRGRNRRLPAPTTFAGGARRGGFSASGPSAGGAKSHPKTKICQCPPLPRRPDFSLPAFPRRTPPHTHTHTASPGGRKIQPACLPVPRKG